MNRGLLVFVSVVMQMLAPGQRSPAAMPPAEVVRNDWYLRESLSAIRDWEAILARREESMGKAEPVPAFPVPLDGQSVEWIQPIPRMLLPAEDRQRRLSLQWVDGKIRVRRVAEGSGPIRNTVEAGATVLGYKHPGGGGKDQWYHVFHRRFDRLTTFRPQPAPFALHLDQPVDWKAGDSELRVQVRNATGRPLTLDIELGFDRPQRSRAGRRREISLTAGAAETVAFRLELRKPGGGLVMLCISHGGDSFHIPLLTYVEDAGAVLAGVEQILADSPDPAAAARLAVLRRRAEQCRSGGIRDGAAWREVFQQAGALRDELLLGRLEFDALLFVKRKPFNSEQPFMDAHHCYNRPGGEIDRLAPVRPDGQVTPVVDSLGEGIYRDLCLHWDGRRMLFAFGNGSDRARDGRPHQENYNVYEAAVDGSRVRRLTSSRKNDCEPFYLPDGRIGFTSDRAQHYVMCGSDIHVANLFTAEADGSRVRQLSFNVFNDFNPCLLPDGRILYSRWEYNERSVTSLHNPFTVNPDGSMMAPYYGNATIRPNVVMFPRPVPRSQKVMALFTAHHGQTHGPIGLIDVRRGVDGPQPIEVLTPGVPITGERIEDSAYGWYSDPQPLSESTYLCSFTPTVIPWLERSWALYVGDRHGNLALVYRDPEISCFEPVPLATRPRPPRRPRLASPGWGRQDEAVLLLADVYVGLPGVPRQTVKYLRIIEDVPRQGVDHGGVICTSGTPIYTVKRILGTVPVEPDGSAHFVVPADRNVYFEVLDAGRLEVQRMRSVVCLKPGERRTCIGCHEPRTMAPPNRFAAAFCRPPSRPQPPPWGTQILSYLRDVQPVLNAKCVSCHTHDRPANRVILTDDLTGQFCIGYEELLPYLAVANAFRWDHPEDVYARPPYTYGSKASRLVQLLSADHHGVELSPEQWRRLVNWIDANAVYYDRYETGHYGNRQIFDGSVRRAMEEVYGRRCAACHGDGDGQRGTWWMSLNRREVGLSRALAAPLARAAGGWGRCDGSVFATREDPDYAKLLSALTGLRERLQQEPREDLLSLQGSPAEHQQVRLPPPPRPPLQTQPPEQGWVWLSELAWESAQAGWTPNGDGLPRRDRNVEGRAIRLRLRRYPQGLGTHAPSEIVYRLDRKYLRLAATVAAAEATGTVVFRVYGDGQLLYDSGVMHGQREVKQLDVSVEAVDRLRLVVTDAGDGYHCDMADWAAARVLRAPGRDND